jgi:hypothetical protein
MDYAKVLITIRNYFELRIENKDLAKQIRDEKLLPVLAKNGVLILDFKDVIFASHTVLNAMLATPIHQLGLPAYKNIKVINVAWIYA